MKENFSEVFVSENNKMGVKSPNGEIIVPACYDEIRYTYCQTISKQPYIAVREGKMGLVSPNGKGTEIAPFVYDNIDILPDLISEIQKKT